MYIFRRFSQLLLLASLLLFGVYLFKNRASVDTKPPVISVGDNLIEISVADGEQKLLEGVTVTDTKDGDISDSLFVESISNFYSGGKRLVTYVAFDSDNHLSRATREIQYTDYSSPEFVLTEPFQYYPGSVNLKISAKDCLDGDITSAIKLISDDPITTDQIGEYEVSFQVANSAGDVSTIPVMIEILDPNKQYIPHIALDRYIVYIDQGEKFKAGNYLQSVILGNREYEIVDSSKKEDSEDSEDSEDDEDNLVNNKEMTIDKSLIKIEGSKNVHTDEAGTYRVKYSVSLKLSNNETVTGHTYLYVVVR